MEKEAEKLKTYRRLLISSLYTEAIWILLQIIEYGFAWFVFVEIASILFCDFVFYKTLKRNEAKLYNKMAQQKIRSAVTTQQNIQSQVYRCPTCNNTVFYGTPICKNCETVFNWDGSSSSDES